MDQTETTAVLNRILQILCRSLPMYLKDARPWSRRDQQQAQAAIDRLVADQEMYARRVADLIVAEDGHAETGRFPTEFAAINDLSLDFLLSDVIARQRVEVAVLRRCAAELSAVPSLRALAEEIVGNAQGHLEILEGLAKAPTAEGRG